MKKSYLIFEGNKIEIDYNTAKKFYKETQRIEDNDFFADRMRINEECQDNERKW